MPDVAGLAASGPMEDFLIPDRVRIGAVLRRLARLDRGQRPIASTNGRSAQLIPTQTAWSETLVTASTEIPQASSVVEIDLSNASARLEAGRDTWLQRGIEPGLGPYFAEALLAAIREVPRANAAFDTQARGIRRYPAVHLGLSLSSDDGRSARYGVIRDADTRNLLGLAIEIEAIRKNGQLEPDMLAQATLTMADFGEGSALFGVPLVLPGQVAAIRFGAVEQRLAPTTYVCASIDHRALDGMDAGALLGALKRSLEHA
jgi:pyruvate/2-oxoglutarate dehydrogenase complex dihydrolipoamide acyltransferase (E2) component